MSPDSEPTSDEIAQFEQTLSQASFEKLRFLLDHTDSSTDPAKYEAIQQEIDRRSKIASPTTSDSEIRRDLLKKTNTLRAARPAEETTETAADPLVKPVQFVEKPLKNLGDTGQFETSHLSRKSRLKIRETLPLPEEQRLKEKHETQIAAKPMPTGPLKIKRVQPEDSVPAAAPSFMPEEPLMMRGQPAPTAGGGRGFMFLLIVALLIMGTACTLFAIMVLDLPGKPQVEKMLSAIPGLLTQAKAQITAMLPGGK